MHLLDFSDILCPEATCPVVVDKFLVYHDESHISATYAKELGSQWEHRLEALGILQPAAIPPVSGS